MISLILSEIVWTLTIPIDRFRHRNHISLMWIGLTPPNQKWMYGCQVIVLSGTVHLLMFPMLTPLRSLSKGGKTNEPLRLMFLL